jgi:tetratricopeptide (TPR) repeat protein
VIKELGITRSALNSFFKEIGQDKVPPEELDPTLRRFSAQYKALQTGFMSFNSADSSVTQIKKSAASALAGGQFERVETLLRQASERDIEVAKEHATYEKARLISAAESIAQIGNLKYSLLEYDEAARYYRQAVEVLPHEAKTEKADYLNRLGLIQHTLTRLQEAETSYKEALSLICSNCAERMTIENNLAYLYLEQFRLEDAEKHMLSALDIAEKWLGPRNQKEVGTILNNMGCLRLEQSRHSEAEYYLTRARSLTENPKGNTQILLSSVLHNLAGLYEDRGEIQRSEEFYERSLATIRKRLGNKHPSVAATLNNLSVFYYNQKNYKKAELFQKESCLINEKAFGTFHPSVARNLNVLGLICTECVNENETPTSDN